MKHNLPSLALVVTIVAIARVSLAQAVGTGVPPRELPRAAAPAPQRVQPQSQSLQQPVRPKASVYETNIVPATANLPTTTPTPAAPLPQTPKDAHELLLRVIKTADKQPSISAQMRHRISMFGHQLVGTGSYQQQGAGDERMLRLDMKVKVAESMTSMQQVCDGRFLWIRRDIGDTRFLGRVDLRRIREATRKGVSPEATADMTNFWMMLGGLPQLLSRLDEHFQFAAPREAMVENSPVWVLDGTWKPASLMMLAPSQEAAIKANKPIDVASLPEQIPTHARLVIRRSDYFPLHIEFLRQGVAAEPDQPPPMSPLLSMEMFDVRLGEAIDPLVFAYKPGDKEVVDHTDLYLQNLGLK